MFLAFPILERLFEASLASEAGILGSSLCLSGTPGSCQHGANSQFFGDISSFGPMHQNVVTSGGGGMCMERGNDTSKSTGRSGRQNAATRRNMQREERATVQGLVKEQQPDGIHRSDTRAGFRCCRVPVGAPLLDF